MSTRSSGVGGGAVSPRSAAAISRNIQGLPWAARPTITASQPVSSIIRSASAPLRTSPLPNTGTDTARFTARMTLQSARPEYCCSRVRACTAMADAPLPSQIRATSTALTLSASQPERIFAVTGRGVASTSARTTAPIFSGSRIMALPSPLPVIFGAGQPKFRSKN